MIQKKILEKYTITENYVDVGERKIFVQLIEDNLALKDAAPIILIPGGPGANASSIFPHLKNLLKHGPVIVFDPADVGKSDPFLRTLESDIEELECIRIFFKIKKWIVLGISYGGIVAQEYAVKYQEHIRKLILSVTIPCYNALQDARQNLSKLKTTEQQHLFASHLLKGEVSADMLPIGKYMKILSPLYSMKVRQNPEKYNDQPVIRSENFSVRTLNNGFKTFLQSFDVIAKLKTIKVPTLVCGGKYDWICDPKHSYTIAKEIPNAHLSIFASGHSILIDCPTAYFKTIDLFFEDVLSVGDTEHMG